MVDGHGPVPECIFRAARRVSRALRRGRRVLLLCVRGRNRSGLLAALAMSYLTGASGRECARRVSRARHMALTNQAFGVLLDQFSPG
jgi:protein-tyrosine phosphatase